MDELIKFNAQALHCCDVETLTQNEFDVIVALLSDYDNNSEAALTLKKELDIRLSKRYLRLADVIREKLDRGERLAKLNPFDEKLIPYCYRSLSSEEGYRTPMHISYMALSLCLPKINSNLLERYDTRLAKDDILHRYLLMIHRKLSKYKGELPLFNYLYYDIQHRFSEFRVFDENAKPKDVINQNRVFEAISALQSSKYPVTAVEVAKWINDRYYKSTNMCISETQVEAAIVKINNTRDLQRQFIITSKMPVLRDDSRTDMILHMFDGLPEDVQRIGRVLIEENYLDNKEKKTINIQDKQYASAAIMLQKRVAQSHVLDNELISAMRKHNGGPGKMLYQVAADEMRLLREQEFRGKTDENES